MKSKKISFNFYQIFENDALKDYLEHMALKGWRLVTINSLVLHFEACDPHPIRYCVEVMEKPSVYASNQTLPLKRYREFCRDAGWNYIGTNGLLHIFQTEDTEALPVETDPRERCDRIIKACRGNNRTLAVLFLLIGLMNLISCWMKRTFLCSQGFVVLILLAAGSYYIGEFLLWKSRAQARLKDTGTLPHMDWVSVRMKNLLSVAVIFVFCILFILYTAAGTFASALPYIGLYLIFYIAAMLIFTGIIHRLREKHNFGQRTNLLIYWGFVIFITLLVIIAVLFLIS